MKKRLGMRILAFGLAVLLALPTAGLNYIAASASENITENEAEEILSEDAVTVEIEDEIPAVDEEFTEPEFVADGDESEDIEEEILVADENAPAGINVSVTEVSMSYTTAEIKLNLPDGYTGKTSGIPFFAPKDAAYDYGPSQQFCPTTEINVSQNSIKLVNLTPGTTYKGKINENGDINSTSYFDFEFTTKPIDVVTTVSNVTWFSADVFVQFKDAEALKAELGKDYKTKFSVKKKSDGTIKDMTAWDDPTVVASAKGDIYTVKDLDEDSEYTVSLCGLIYNDSTIVRDAVVKSFDIKTTPDTRTLELKGLTPSYSKASFTVEMSGSVEGVKTYYALFIRKKGEDKYKRASLKNTTSAAFTDVIEYKELEPETEYEYVIGLANKDNPDKIEDLRKSVSGEFKTLKDQRKVSAAVSAGYQTAGFKISYENNNDEGQTFVHLFYRENGQNDDSWKEAEVKGNKNESRDREKTFYLEGDNKYIFLLENLTQGTKYDYRVILNGKKNGTKATDPVVEPQVCNGSFTTKKCGYELQMEYLPEKSSFGYEYVKISLVGSKEDYKVTGKMRVASNDPNDWEEHNFSLFRDDDYTDEIIFTNLTPVKEYGLASYELKVNENFKDVVISSVTCEPKKFTFTTREVVIPTEIKSDVTEVYLNCFQSNIEGVGRITPVISVNEGADASYVIRSENKNIADIDAKTKSIYAKAPGDVKVIVESRHDVSIKTEILVHVADIRSYADGREIESVYGNKDEHSSVISLARVDGTQNTKVEITGSKSDRPSVAVFNDKESVINYMAVGRTDVYLESNEYKVVVNADVTIDKTAFYISGLTDTSADHFDGVSDGKDGLILATGKNYKINLKSVDGTVINDLSQFDFYIENPEGVAIRSDKTDETGIFKAGSPIEKGIYAKLVVTPKENGAYYASAPSEILFTVRDIPALLNAGTDELNGRRVIYMPVNAFKKLKDYELSDGYKWIDGDADLYSLPKTREYIFEAVCEDETKYPRHQEFIVYLSEIFDLELKNRTRSNCVIEGNGVDELYVKVSFSYYGYLPTYVDLFAYDKIEHVYIRELQRSVDNSAGRVTFEYGITSDEAGEYTFDFHFRMGNIDLSKLSVTVKLTVTDKVQIKGFNLFYVSGPEERTHILNSQTQEFIYNPEDKEGYSLELSAYDFGGNYLEPQATEGVEWISGDTSVVTVEPVDSEDIFKAVLKPQKDGNAIITVKSKDETGLYFSFSVRIKNLQPRVDFTTVSLNKALDYSKNEGRNIAYDYYGFTEVVEAYDGRIESYSLYKRTQKTFEKEKENLEPTPFGLNVRDRDGKKELIPVPIDPAVKTGKYNCWLVTKLAEDKGGYSYSYPITVKVVDEKVKVTAKSDTVNTFYMVDDNAEISFTFKGKYNGNPKVTWLDNSDVAGGFDIGKDVYYNTKRKKNCVRIGTKNLAMDGRKIAEGVDTGTLIVTFPGYLEPVEIAKFKIKNKYKIPVIISKPSKSGVSTDCGIDEFEFALYNKTNKAYVIKKTGATGKEEYTDIDWENDNIIIRGNNNSSTVTGTYVTDSKSEKFVLKLRSTTWREKVIVKHSVKNYPAKLVLSKKSMTFNVNLHGSDYSAYKIKGVASDVPLKEMKFSGKNAAAQKLLDKNVISFILASQKKRICVTLNDIDALDEIPAAGTYSYSVTPVYVSRSTGKEVIGKAAVIKVKLVSKAPSVKVTLKGSIDLAKVGESFQRSSTLKKTAIRLTEKFANVNSNYSVVGMPKLVGAYANYFEVVYGDDGFKYIRVKNGLEGRLKKGFTYKLKVKYTLKMASSYSNDDLAKNEGETVDIYSSVIKIKPKQSVPKVSVKGNNQVLYASNANVVRYGEASIKGSYYWFGEVNGSLDVNKDGKADITVTEAGTSSETTVKFKIKLSDCDAVKATEKGVVYSIPVTFTLKGADGVSKNVVSTVKVKVKK